MKKLLLFEEFDFEEDIEEMDHDRSKKFIKDEFDVGDLKIQDVWYRTIWNFSVRFMEYELLFKLTQNYDGYYDLDLNDEDDLPNDVYNIIMDNWDDIKQELIEKR